MRSWYHSRYDKLIAEVRLEMQGLSMATKAWERLDTRLDRLKRRQREAKAHEEREANPRYCEVCGGRLHFGKTYERGLCIEHFQPREI